MGKRNLKAFLVVGIKGLSVYILISTLYALVLHYNLKETAFFTMIGALSSIIGNWALSDTLYLEKSEPRDIILNSVVGLIVVMTSLALYTR